MTGVCPLVIVWSREVDRMMRDHRRQSESTTSSTHAHVKTGSGQFQWDRVMRFKMPQPRFLCSDPSLSMLMDVVSA
ncbi:unnamed protein product [Amaranthus hypochondriacus]